MRLLLSTLCLSITIVWAPASAAISMDEEAASPLPVPRPGVVEDRFALLALSCIHRPYPNKIAHVLQSDADALPPRTLTPVFYGCFDWHSSVHGHWLLTRILNTDANSPLRPFIMRALAQSFSAENIAAEVRYLRETLI
jgi:hypothetical protein